MKITKNYLKQLIKEELNKIQEMESPKPAPKKTGTRVLEVQTEMGEKYFMEVSERNGYIEVWSLWDSQSQPLNIKAMDRSKFLDLKYDAANQIGAEVD